MKTICMQGISGGLICKARLIKVIIKPSFLSCIYNYIWMLKSNWVSWSTKFNWSSTVFSKLCTRYRQYTSCDFFIFWKHKDCSMNGITCFLRNGRVNRFHKKEAPLLYLKERNSGVHVIVGEWSFTEDKTKDKLKQFNAFCLQDLAILFAANTERRVVFYFLLTVKLKKNMWLNFN